LEVAAGHGHAFLHDPLLRGGFLDDVYECFDDSKLADEIMTAVSEDVPTFAPLIAHRCVLSGWKPSSEGTLSQTEDDPPAAARPTPQNGS